MATEAHASGQEDEDTLTGQFGAFLRTRRPRQVRDGRRTWTWSINYGKFRGRGPNATERIIGADGIIEFSLDDVEQHVKKASLFQAKTGRDTDLQRLLSQSILMTTWKEAAFVIRYAPGGYTAFDLETALKLALGLPRPPETPLDEFLTDSFIACTVGDSELHYEPAERILRWRDTNRQIVHTTFAIRHHFDIRVEGPGRFFYVGEPVTLDGIHDHRMEATDEEMLGVDRNPDSKDVNRARREHSKIYHPDKYQQLDPGVQHIIDMRMKETNTAADRILSRIREDRKR
jgi:hypothetical protein